MRLPCTADWSWRRAIIKIASPAMQDLPKGDLACWRLEVPMSCAALKISKACSFLSFLTLSTTCIFEVHASIATSSQRRKSCRNYWHWPWPRALRRRPLRKANGISRGNLMDGTFSLVVDETVSIFFPRMQTASAPEPTKATLSVRGHLTGRHHLYSMATFHKRTWNASADQSRILLSSSNLVAAVNFPTAGRAVIGAQE
jgi:hypothetical protein